MRVFLDTNVLASALATRGLCADVLREVTASHKLVTSPLILSELARVLERKFGVQAELAAEVVALLRRDAVVAEGRELPSVKLKDHDDLPHLAAAIAGRAEVFVTGDKELLALGRVESLGIVSPRQFWEGLRKQHGG